MTVYNVGILYDAGTIRTKQTARIINNEQFIQQFYYCSLLIKSVIQNHNLKLRELRSSSLRLYVQHVSTEFSNINSTNS